MIRSVKQVSDENLCISRRPYGRGFRYYDENNNAITDKSLLKRIRKLIIPPMWDEVMICNWEDGHIQATGRDAKGRKQYIYHSKYEEAKQQEKFDRMLDFGKQLSSMRNVNYKQVKKSKWSKAKVLSLVVMVLDETGLRIGNRQYAIRNGTYGLTTLRRKHVEVASDSIAFEYKGKSNQIRQVEIDDPYLAGLIKKSSELPGYELFRYKDQESEWQTIDSDDVNQWIHKHMGDQFSSKDFRTWVASRLAIELYSDALAVKEDYPRKKFTNILLRLVADELGNTPTVCKSYYIHPKILGKISDQSITWTPAEKEETKHRLSSSEIYLLKCLRGKK